MKLEIGGYHFEQWSRRKEKHEHLKTSYCLAINFAQLSQGKMVGNLSGLHNELHKVKKYKSIEALHIREPKRQINTKDEYKSRELMIKL